MSRPVLPTVTAALLLVVCVLHARPLRAQACIGYPQGTAGALAVSLSFPDDATAYSLGGMAASQNGRVFFNASFGITDYDLEGLENSKSVSGGMAFEIRALSPDLSVCPLADVGFSWVEDQNAWFVPFGFGVGRTVALDAEGISGLTPFLSPQFVYARFSIDDVDDSVESDVHPAIGAGATLHVGSIAVTGSVGKVFQDGSEAVFGFAVSAVW